MFKCFSACYIGNSSGNDAVWCDGQITCKVPSTTFSNAKGVKLLNCSFKADGVKLFNG